MLRRIIWTVAATGGYLMLVTLPEPAGTGWSFASWVYGAAYGLLGVALLGMISHWWVRGSPALWRPLMLGAGSLAAAGELWWRAGTPTVMTLPLDQWMVALLGLLAAGILARFAPDRVAHLWFGVERRQRRF
ncbi:MAG: hypothetical protein OEV31_00805 [Gammaproteobacteria bacterium]|nr:hypothetical protein [Gammaproteobacteria bacterium]